jgi:Tfp pilus assembly protein PilF
MVLATLFFGLSLGISGQADEICGEFGIVPSLEGPRLSGPLVYGQISVKTTGSAAKFPRIYIIYVGRDQKPDRLNVGKSGNYCFKRTESGGGNLVIDIEGVEVARRTLPAMGVPQQREDFDILLDATGKYVAPSVVSSKFHYPANPKTLELYKKATEAEAARKINKATDLLQQIVAADPADFRAWAMLGAYELQRKSLADAEAALRRSIELKQEYPAPWVTVGRLRIEQKQYEAAIEILKHATELDPKSARAYQYLGDAYLQSKQGSLGVEALNRALELDPKGMADSHLMIPRLYELAGAKHLAAREFKLYLEKVPNYPERKKLEKFIRDNSDPKQ